MALCRQGGLPGLDTALAIKARLQQARGDVQGALATAQSLAQVLPGGDPALTVRLIRLHLASGNLDEAWRLAAPLPTLLERTGEERQAPLLLAEMLSIVVARVLLARGEGGRAMSLLDAVQETAGPSARNGRLIEVSLLKALALQEQAQGAVTPEAREAAREAARDAMGRALQPAAGEGYVLLFLEEGQRVMPLLQAIDARRETPEAVKVYARQLLEAFDQDATPPGAVDGLVEALTPREMEVLQLIAAGHTNRAIAERLVITVRTVKKHASNIYGKLNVSSRTQAMARARELGLLAEKG
jgi:LuxR family maltose regulon positive regulatory protein